MSSDEVKPAAAPAPAPVVPGEPAAAAAPAPAPSSAAPAPAAAPPAAAPAPVAAPVVEPPAAVEPKPPVAAPKADPPQADDARKAVDQWQKARAEVDKAPAAEKEAKQKAADELKAQARTALDAWRKVDAPAADKTAASLEAAPAPPTYEELRKEGFDLTDEHIKEVQAYADQRQLSAEQMKVILRHQADLKKMAADGAVATRKAWRHEFEIDPEFGGPRFRESVEGSKRVLEKYGNEKLKGIMNQGFGDNPDFNRFLAALYYAGMASDKYVRPGVGEKPTQPKTRAAEDAALFPLMAKQLSGEVSPEPSE